jgi:hypothetical protein
VPDGSATAKAIDYSRGRWIALKRYLDDGNLPCDNNWVENQLRPIAIGRYNWLFAGSLRAGKRAAAIMSLVHSAKMNGHDPYAYLRDVLERLPTQPASRISELLPHHWPHCADLIQRCKVMKPHAQSPQELQEALATIFPAFAADLPAIENDRPELGERTVHSLVMDFGPFFARDIDSWTDRQLRWLGEHIVEALAEGGSIGNAWDTCFLEHSRQLKVNRRLAPRLASARAKRKA